MNLTTALVLALAAAGGWSIYDLLRRLLAGRVAAWTLVALVTLGALPPLALWSLAAGDWRIAPGYLLPAFASVALNVAANLAYFRSLQLAPISITLPLLSLTPAFAALMAWPLLGEQVAPRGALGIVMVVAGALALSRPSARARGGAGLLRSLASERGSLLMAGVALCWSATLLLDKVSLRYAAPTVHALVLNAGVAAAALLALGARRELRTLAVPGKVWALLALSVACGVLTLTAQFEALRALDVALIETLKRGVGATLALVYGRLLFAEPLTPRKLASVAAMVVGVALLLT